MTFAEPWAFALLAIPPLVIAIHLYLIWRRQQVAARFAEPERFGELSRGGGAGGTLLRGCLIAAATALLALAVAQPRWGTSETETTRQGADVVVVLDISLSMNARDVDPDRLSRAKEDIASLISRLQGDRVGLVVFAGESVVRFPLTDDEQTALQVVEDLTTTSILGEGSAVANGLETAAELLSESPAESRVIALYSDGENFGAAPIEAAFAAAQAGTTIHAVGVGTEAGSTIPVFDPEQQTEVLKIDGRTGQPAVTRLAPGLLRGISEVGGGRYLQLSRPNESVAADLAAEVRRLEQTTFGSQTATLPVERYQLFAGLAFALLIVERLIPARAVRWFGTRTRRLAIPALGLALVVLLGSCSADSFEDQVRRGNDLFDEGDYEGALDEYREAQQPNSERAEGDYNAGNALFRLAEFDRAASDYLRALEVAEGGLVEDIYFNLGNAYFREGRFDDAVGAYREVLLLNPDDIDAKVNLELALLAQANEASSGTPGSDEGQQVPESGLGGEETEAGETEEAGQQQSQGEEGASEDEAEQRLDDALGEAGEQLSIEEALAILEALEDLQGEQDTPGIDIIGVDDY